MSIIIDGTNGISDIDGTASTPAIRGTDANTGIFFPAADTVAISEGGVESARFNSSGNLQLVNSLSVGNATPTTSGAGITFPATQSASTDANTLDDYEEGTWTPSVGGTTSNPTLTYATRLGYYTKVGRVVTIHCAIQPSSTSVNGDGGLVITGLPFTSANLGDCVGTGVSYSNGNLNWGTNKTSLVLAVSPNVTRISVWGMQNATAEAAVGVTAFTTSNQYLLFSLTYITST